MLATAALAVAGPASAAPPAPVPGTPSCHGLIIAAAAQGTGLGNLAREEGVPVIPLHDLLFAPCVE
ncbi:MAG TPA: hypothetical protein VHF23_07925 [Gaiellaceae bacterium]|nr:hypothetical protein [Gaiellaceae bacterium]